LRNNEYINIITKEINNIIDKQEDINELLKEAMKYSINAGGKRLRPLLLIEVYKAISKNDIKAVLNYACAIEIIHTYSLIHDDLPSMDNDCLRRNKPTNHIVFGEDLAILAGDALLNTAMEILINEIKDEKTKKVSLIIAKAAGASGMISGQVYDIKKAKNKEQLEVLYDLKTTKLIKCAIIAGAYLANANQQVIDKLDKYADNIGLAFQISDDILDIEGKEEEIGKTLNSDVKNNKSTYISFYGLKQSKILLEELINKALQIISELNIMFLDRTAKYILERKK